MRRSRSPVRAHSSKRTRRSLSHTDTSNANKFVPQNNQTSIVQTTPISSLLRYPFVVPLVAQILRDGDVLVGMLPTTREMARLLSGYAFKGEIKQSNIRSQASSSNATHDHTLQVTITRMRDVTDLHLARHTSLKSARLTEVFRPADITASLFPSSLTELHFSGFNQPITQGMFPVQLKKLRLRDFDHRIPVGSLPESLQELEILCSFMGSPFNQRLLAGSLPSSLTSLTFDNKVQFNRPIDFGVLPKSLKSLVLPRTWNQLLTRGMFPSKLETLRFGDIFDQPIEVDVLPSSLTELEFGWNFDQMLQPGSIPSSVTNLICQSDADILQPGSLLSGLKRLEYFHREPDRSMAGIFPDTLEFLVMCQPVEVGDLPASLKHLEIDLYDGQLDEVLGHPQVQQLLDPGIFPSALEYLLLESKYHLPLRPGVLPASLTELHLIGHRGDLMVGSLPAQLIHLTLDDRYVLSSDVSEEQRLTFLCDRNFDKTIIPGIIPFGVKSVTFGYHFVHSLLPGTIPASVTKLEIGGRVPSIPIDSIPTSVTHLTLRQMVDAGVIPSSVTHLSLMAESYQPIAPGIIPSSVTHLRLGSGLSQPLAADIIPSSVTTLDVFPHHLPTNVSDIIPAFVTSLELFLFRQNGKLATLVTLPCTALEVLIPACNVEEFGRVMKLLDPSIRVAHGALQW